MPVNSAYGNLRPSLEHAVEFIAASVYEAAVLALAEFRRCGFADATFGPARRLTIRVKQPETRKVARLLSDNAGSEIGADKGEYGKL